MTLRFDSARSRRTNRNVEPSIFAVSFFILPHCHIRKPRWILDMHIDFVYRDALYAFISVARDVSTGRFRGCPTPNSEISRNKRNRCSEIFTYIVQANQLRHTHTRSQLRPTINRRRSVTLTNHRQVTRIAHYYSRINVIRCVVDIAHYVY